MHVDISQATVADNRNQTTYLHAFKTTDHFLAVYA